MSLVRTSLSREKPSFSGISFRFSLRHCEEPQATRQSSRCAGLLRFARNDGLRCPSSEQPVDEPGGSAAASVADHTFAIDPVAAAGRILDLVIVAEPAGRRLAPPFGRDSLGPLG